MIINGRMKMTVYLRPDQYHWLRALSLEKLLEEGRGRINVSTLLEGMVDLYQQQTRGRKAK